MSHPTTDTPARLGERVDAVADQFEAAWKAVQPPHVAAFVADATGTERDALLTELREIDRLYRAKLTERAAADTVTITDNPSAPAFPTIPGYEIAAELGRGGMSIVYLARDRRLKRPVALKLLRAGADAGGRQRQRFRAEAEAAARLQHPHIAQVYEVGEHDGQLYLALEYVPGGSLSRHLAGKPLPARAAAELVETLACAMHHAHQHGIVHRDLKPANILLGRKPETRKPKSETNPKTESPMTQTSGPEVSDLRALDLGFVSDFGFRVSDFSPKVCDFGLAKLLDADAGQTRTGEIVGTPSYMAPEQTGPTSPQRQQGQTIGPLVDVYALGAILYELLTGRPPFQGETFLDTLADVRTQEPVPPRRLRAGVPRDLETVCLKALAKEPARRYADAEALADDLRRWLAGEPIEARPVGRAEKVWRWCRRNPGMAGLAAAVVLLMVGVSAVSAWAAISRERELHVQKAQLFRTSVRQLGWRDKAWREVKDAAAIYRHDENHRLWKEATAVLAGIDAKQVKWFEAKRKYEHDASSAAFSPDGKWLLLGGANDEDGKPVLPARLWQLGANDVQASQKSGAGPVAFRPDGTPLQLVAEIEPPSLLLWDVAKGQSLTQPTFPDDLKVARLARNTLDMAVTALSPDGALIAAVGETENDEALVAVWDAATAKLLWHQKVAANTLALAFSSGKPDQRVLAVAGAAGQVIIHSVQHGKEIHKFPPMGNAIHCLAFSNDRRYVACGDSGGAVNIWDWENGRPVSRCPGSHYDVYAVAFSPDGTLLASDGRNNTRLWDVATGQPLLNIEGTSNYVTGLAFSPDGECLAACGRTGDWGPGHVRVWELEYGRGIQTLRGLSSQVTKVRFSPDGRRVAALGLDWRVAIWNVENGSLQHLLQVPAGDRARNAGLVLSNNRLAFASGKQAKLWDLDSGTEVGRGWEIPPGYHDHLVFDTPERLLLFRMETAREDEYPRYGLDWHKHPRVFRVRELVVDKPVRMIRQITEFNRHVQSTAVAPDGSYFLVDGIRRDAQGRLHRALHRYETAGGASSWSMEAPEGIGGGGGIVAFDPTGQFLALSWESEYSLVEAATGKRVGTFPAGTFCSGLSPGAKLLARQGGAGYFPESPGLALVRHAQGNPIVVLGLMSPHVVGLQFYGERYIAWGNQDGSVSLCDLFAINEKLTNVGLGW